MDTPLSSIEEYEEEKKPPKFVFGSYEMPGKLQYTPPEFEPRESCRPGPANILCYRRSNLERVPDSIFREHLLTYLCLEGNQISVLPGAMFLILHRLQWLDLRRNLITELPPEIGCQCCLKTLLLEGNPIAKLPVELGDVSTLRGLTLRDCPIVFPPAEILHLGVQAILYFLRCAQMELLGTERSITPEVEKLPLSDLPSVEELEESADEDGLTKFKELKDKLMLLDMAEMDSSGHEDKNPKPIAPYNSLRNTSTEQGSTQESKYKPSKKRYFSRPGPKEKQTFVLKRKEKPETAQMKDLKKSPLQKPNELKIPRMPEMADSTPVPGIVYLLLQTE